MPMGLSPAIVRRIKCTLLELSIPQKSHADCANDGVTIHHLDSVGSKPYLVSFPHIKFRGISERISV